MIFVSDFSQLRKQRCLQLLKHAPSTQHVQKNTCPHIFRNSGSSATCSSSNTPPARSTCTKHVSTHFFAVLGAALPAAPSARPQHAARTQNTCPHVFSQFWEQRYLQLLKHAPSTQHVLLWRRATAYIALSVLRAVSPGCCTAAVLTLPSTTSARVPGSALDLLRDTTLHLLMVRVCVSCLDVVLRVCVGVGFFQRNFSVKRAAEQSRAACIVRLRCPTQTYQD